MVKIHLQWGRPGFELWVGKIPLEKGMATHSSFLAWRIPSTEKPGSPWGQKESVSQTEQLSHHPWNAFNAQRKECEVPRARAGPTGEFLLVKANRHSAVTLSFLDGSCPTAGVDRRSLN